MNLGGSRPKPIDFEWISGICHSSRNHGLDLDCLVMIKTIIVAVDGSSHSDKAVDLAIDIAAKYRARLSFVHVMAEGPLPENLKRMAEIEHLGSGESRYPAPPVPEGKFPASMGPAGEGGDKAHEVRRFVGGKILSAAESAAKKNGVADVGSVLEEGDPVAKILALVEKEGADLIVMGNRGLGGSQRSAYGQRFP